MTSANFKFLCSYVLDGKGRGTPVDRTAVEQWSPEQGKLWVHIDVADKGSHHWLTTASGVDEVIADALLAGETRPRSMITDDGLLVVLRGVNTNPGADPEDMVSIRVWIERDRVISTRRRKLLSIQDMRDHLARGDGPTGPDDFLAALVERLADRIGDFVESIEDHTAKVEDSIAEGATLGFRKRLGALRRQIAEVRRFLAPQRDALDRLIRHPCAWLSDDASQRLREDADRITRYLEDLDLARERAVVLQEEFLSLLAQEQNSRMYVLSVVAAIFLPLTFITGLLGMNVGGLPGVDSQSGFFGAMLVMIIATAGLVVYFRSKKWL